MKGFLGGGGAKFWLMLSSLTWGDKSYTASQRADSQNCVLETHFFLLSQQSPLSLFVCLFHLLLICEMFYLLLDT